MQLHTDLLTDADMRNAARAAHVDFIRCEEAGSRTRTRRFDFILEGYASNRRPNWGTGDRDTHDGYAATWDEWGIFLNFLLQRDPEAHCGKHSYLGLEHFKHQTGGRYDDLTHTEQHINHNWKWDSTNNQSQCPCGAVRRYDNPQALVIVKHGLISINNPESVDRWIGTSPVQRAVAREQAA